MGLAGTGFGMISCGWVVHHLLEDLHWDKIPAYRVVFFGYSAVGLFKLALALMLTPAVEADRKKRVPVERDISEGTPLLQQPVEAEPGWLRSRLPHISRESVSVVISLCFFFALDAFASGLAPL